jgi:hypothetical protein
MRRESHNRANMQKRSLAAKGQIEKRRRAVADAMRQQKRNREPLSFKRALAAAAAKCDCSVAAIRAAKPVNRWTARESTAIPHGE